VYGLLGCPGEFPKLGIFPGDVGGVVEVKEQSFTAVEKAEPE
jgi:hypothetical protein